MGISSLGVGTGGIDTASMLEQIRAGEQTRLTPYTSLKSKYQSQISDWGKISSLMSTLQKSITTMSGDAFSKMNVSSNEAFTATAASGAQADSHSVTISQLAAAHKLKTQPQTSADTALGTSNSGGTRTITITQEDGKTMEVELEDDETSLNQIAKAINKEKGSVTASVQRTDDGYQLVLSSKTTGSDGQMTVKVNGDASLAGVLDTSNGGQHIDDQGQVINDPGQSDNMISVSDAKDAKLRVDGSDYTRSSNNITDIIEGVTLNLKTVSENGEEEQLTLTSDTSAIKTSLQDFVKQYNALLKQTTSSSKYVAADMSGLGDEEVATENSDNGALMGDSTLRGLVSELRSTVNGVYGDAGATYGSLADLGITIDAASGQMTLDEDTLDEAIADNPEEIATMFSGRGDNEGLATSLGKIMTDYLGDSKTDTDGIIEGATESLEDQTEIVQAQIDKTQKLIDAQVEVYRVQFQNLDSLMTNLNGMSSQLTSLLSTL
ncbi:flagellar filament capping protein FliD [Kosakonia cowanii]|uniref:flagellar filament capping protein FliD n=1 Tax=Kosakonia cowanii TaxID=208223 RepID=UPI0023F653FC|nr:flagellar filament capping protein FliD [Kosakonia cowanii]MDF7759602.1 flagellar filament capping protein FliD [Kosakonia cowanii]